MNKLEVASPGHILRWCDGEDENKLHRWGGGLKKKEKRKGKKKKSVSRLVGAGACGRRESSPAALLCRVRAAPFFLSLGPLSLSRPPGLQRQLQTVRETAPHTEHGQNRPPRRRVATLFCAPEVGERGTGADASETADRNGAFGNPDI